MFQLHVGPGSEMIFDDDEVHRFLADSGHEAWSTALRQRAADAHDSAAHGNLEHWDQVVQALPTFEGATIRCDQPAVAINADVSATQRDALRDQLMTFHPWRKGPFDVCGIHIDTEWRSDLKWQRVASHVDWRDATVLDVGSGNGYYGWRMLGEGAARVIGLDPFPLYVAQHRALSRLAGPTNNHVLIGGDTDVPQRLHFFDVAVSMGVLYHRTSPIDHLQQMFHSLRPDGTLLLETLIVDRDDDWVLVPEGRYAKMRNVWFIPSTAMLLRFLRRSGFVDARVVDVTATTSEEQRRTDWMTFESLANFMSPDGSKTIEGYPPPVRATVVARRRK